MGASSHHLRTSATNILARGHLSVEAGGRGGQSATFPMETVDVEKVGMCFGSGGDVGIWVSQLRGCVEPPADIETSSTLALQWMPAMMTDRELARWSSSRNYNKI